MKMKEKKQLLNFLWFLVGMTAIAAIPLLLIEQCSDAGKPGIRRKQEPIRDSADHSRGRYVICGNLIITCRA